MIKYLNRGKFVHADMQFTVQLLLPYTCLFVDGYTVKQAIYRC